MRAAPRAWYHMVQREFSFSPTILTLKVVALEDILTGKVDSLVGSVDVTIQPDNGWHRVGTRDAANLMAVGRTNHFALVEVYKNERPLHRTNHQRAKILIQNEDSAIHGEKI